MLGLPALSRLITQPRRTVLAQTCQTVVIQSCRQHQPGLDAAIEYYYGNCGVTGSLCPGGMDDPIFRLQFLYAALNIAIANEGLKSGALTVDDSGFFAVADSSNLVAEFGLELVIALAVSGGSGYRKGGNPSTPFESYSQVRLNARLALPRGGASLSQQRLDHIIARHWSTSGTTNAGHFGPGTTGRNLTGMINDTVRNGSFRPNTGGRSGIIFEHDFESTIGTNAGGSMTSRLRVVVDPSGNVVTAFPY